VLDFIDILLLVGVWAGVYISRVEYLGKSAKAGEVTIWATYAGGILLIIVLEATRRSLGNIMPTLAIIFHKPMRWQGPIFLTKSPTAAILSAAFLSFFPRTPTVCSETTLSVSATVIFMFVAFGAFLEVSGCSDFINNMAISLTGHIKSGPALSAVVLRPSWGPSTAAPSPMLWEPAPLPFPDEIARL
jgi:TRAP-type uncharacterized transport system fused permease subunit